MPVTCDEMKRAEEAAFARGVEAEDLMEQAGRALAEIVRQYHRRPGKCVVFCGKGHNGGDALVAARHLGRWGWEIDLRLAFSYEVLAPLERKKFAELQDCLAKPDIGKTLVVLDGLLGLGARREPTGEIAQAIQEINRLRREEGAWVLAIDLPSGLDANTGEPSQTCVEADLTATIGLVKQGLVADAAIHHVGRLAVIDLPELAAEPASDEVATPRILRSWLPPRRFDMHKGDAGRVGIVAGSPGFSGAAVMCSAAAVKAGGGLVTVLAKPDTAPLLTNCLPEVMVKTVANYRDALEENFDVLAVGPGLGRRHDTEILALIREAKPPLVVDADGLNALATDLTLLKHCAGPRLLTPHPGEMERLSPRQDRSRHAWLEAFLAEYPATLLLKGSRTLTGFEGRKFYNSTGNPGMASGGMGDVLTGVCAALIPQTGSLLRSAVLGAWLCGRAAEIAVFEPGGSPESLRASDVIARLGAAFGDLRAGAF